MPKYGTRKNGTVLKTRNTEYGIRKTKIHGKHGNTERNYGTEHTPAEGGCLLNDDLFHGEGQTGNPIYQQPTSQAHICIIEKKLPIF
jgi:hypothetical protein